MCLHCREERKPIAAIVGPDAAVEEQAERVARELDNECPNDDLVRAGSLSCACFLTSSKHFLVESMQVGCNLDRRLKGRHVQQRSAARQRSQRRKMKTANTGMRNQRKTLKPWACLNQGVEVPGEGAAAGAGPAAQAEA